MQVKREDLSKVKVKLTVELTKAEVKPHIEKVYKELVKGLKIDGFRPGKAPQFVVEKEVGQDKFYSQVLDSILPESYYNTITKEKIITVSRPDIKVTKYAPTDGLTFEAEVEILPQFDLPDYKKIKISKKEIKVSAKDIEGSIKELQEKYAEFKNVSRKAKKDDRVEVNFEGTQKGTPVQGTKGDKYPITIGGGMFIPEFEENLIGMSKGEEKIFDVIFPKDYHEKKLQGEKVTFKVKVVSISEKVIPEVDNDFAKKFGIFKNVDELKKGVEKNLKETKEMEEKRRLEEKIMTLITEKIKMDVPEALISQEVHRMRETAEANLRQSGITMERYLEMSKKTKEELEKEMRPDAEKRVKYGLILSKITEAEKVQVTNKEVEDEKAVILAQSGQTNEEMKKNLNNKEAEHQIKNGLLAKKTMEKLFKYCVSN